jgi:hypothetical protein
MRLARPQPTSVAGSSSPVRLPPAITSARMSAVEQGAIERRRLLAVIGGSVAPQGARFARDAGSRMLVSRVAGRCWLPAISRLRGTLPARQPRAVARTMPRVLISPLGAMAMRRPGLPGVAEIAAILDPCLARRLAEHVVRARTVFGDSLPTRSREDIAVGAAENLKRGSTPNSSRAGTSGRDGVALFSSSVVAFAPGPKKRGARRSPRAPRNAQPPPRSAGDQGRPVRSARPPHIVLAHSARG